MLLALLPIMTTKFFFFFSKRQLKFLDIHWVGALIVGQLADDTWIQLHHILIRMNFLNSIFKHTQLFTHFELSFTPCRLCETELLFQTSCLQASFSSLHLLTWFLLLTQARRLTRGSHTCWCWWPLCSPTSSTRWTRPPHTGSSNLINNSGCTCRGS